MSVSEIVIAPAGPADMNALAVALTALSSDLGDTHRATADDIARACLGPDPACHGLLARAGAEVAGAALVSPLFSTTQGAAGVHVSDLWVAPAFRGRKLGQSLLREAAMLGARRWQARFLKLAVYTDNTRALDFYDRLGFRLAGRERACLLASPAFDTLIGDWG